MTAITRQQPFSLAPTSFSEAERFSELIARSSFAPKGYAGKPGDVLVAIQMGAEVGLAPMQALQNIAKYASASISVRCSGVARSACRRRL